MFSEYKIDWLFNDIFSIIIISFDAHSEFLWRNNANLQKLQWQSLVLGSNPEYTRETVRILATWPPYCISDYYLRKLCYVFVYYVRSPYLLLVWWCLGPFSGQPPTRPCCRFQTVKLLWSKGVGICVLHKLQEHKLIAWYYFYMRTPNSWRK